MGREPGSSVLVSVPDPSTRSATMADANTTAGSGNTRPGSAGQGGTGQSGAGAEVQAEFDALRRDISKLTDAVARLVGESAEEDKVQAREHVQRTAAAAQQAARTAGAKVSSFDDEKPATARKRDGSGKSGHIGI